MHFLSAMLRLIDKPSPFLFKVGMIKSVISSAFYVNNSLERVYLLCEAFHISSLASIRKQSILRWKTIKCKLKKKGLFIY